MRWLIVVLLAVTWTNPCKAQTVLAQTYLEAGWDSQEAGNHEAAIRSLDLAIREAQRGSNLRRLALAQALRGVSLVALERWADAQKELARALKTAKKAYDNPHDPVIVEIADNLALSYSRQDKHAAAELYYRWLLVVHEKALPRDHDELQSTVFNLAITLEKQEKYPEAITHYRRLVDESTRKVGRRDAQTQTRLVDLAECHYLNGEVDEASKIGDELKASMAASSPTEVPAYVRLQRKVAWMMHRDNRREEAVRVLEEVLSVLNGSFSKIIEVRSEVLSDLGDHYLQLDRVDDALRVYREQVQLVTDEYGATNVKTLDALYSLAWTCYRAKAYDQAVEFADQARKEYEQTLGADDVKVAHVERVLGHVARAQENWEQASEHYRRSGSFYQRGGKDWAQNAVDSYNDLSSMLIQLDRPAEARRALEQALAVREAAYGTESLEAARSLSDLAWFHRMQGDLITAERLYEESITRSEVAVGKDSPELSQFLTALASLYRAQGKNDMAEQLLTRNLRSLEARGNTVELKQALSDLADLLEVLARYSEAEQFARRAVTVAEAVHGPSTPETAREQKQLAWIMMRLDRWDEGRRIGLAAVDVLERAGSRWEESLAGAYNTVAACFRGLHDLNAVEAYYKKGLAIEERLDFNGAHYLVHNLGLLYGQLDKLDLAEQYIRDALQRLERHIAANPAKSETTRLRYANSRARSLNALADVCLKTNRLDEAEALLRQELAIREEAFDDDHGGLLETLSSLSNLLAAQDKYLERIPLAERRLQIVERSVPGIHLDRAYAVAHLAEIRDQQGFPVEAEKLHRQAVEIAEQVYGRGNPQLVYYYDDLYDAASEAGRIDEARMLAGRISDLGVKLLSDDSRHVAVLAVKAAVASLQGDYRTALKVRQEILAFVVAHRKELPHNVARRHIAIAQAAVDLGDLSVAREALDAAHRIFSSESAHRLVRAWLSSVEADYAEAAGDERAEEAQRREAVELRRKTPDVYPQSLIDDELALAWQLAESGELEEAMEILTTAQDRMQTRIDVLPPLKAFADQTAAYVRLMNGQPTAALTLAKAAYERRAELYGATHPRVAWSTWLLGKIHLELGNTEEARRFAEMTVEIREPMVLEGSRTLATAYELLLECQQAAGDELGAGATRQKLSSARGQHARQISMAN